MSIAEHRAIALEEFCITGSGGTPSRNNKSFYGGTIPWVKSGELREKLVVQTEERITEEALKKSSAKMVPAGAILLAMYGATVGRLAMLGVDAATNQAICNIRPDPRLADAKYVYRALESKVPELIAQATGGAQPNISQEKVRNLKIPLPPLDEQKRIAAILDKADQLRQQRRQAIALLDSLTQSIFLEMFGTSKGQVRKIGELISDGTFLMHKDGNHGSNYPRAEEFGEEGIPFLSAPAIAEDGALLPGKGPYFNIKKASSLTIGWIQAGDVLLSHNASVGKVGIYRGEFGPALIGTSLTAFRGDPNIIAPEFLYSQLRSDYFQRQLTKSMSQTTRNQVPITAQRNLEIRLPDISRQQEFMSVANVVQVRLDKMALSLRASQHLFASLQHRAFAGQL